MRELSPSTLHFISGASGDTVMPVPDGTKSIGAAMRGLGTASSAIGYMSGVNVLNILGVHNDFTVGGTTAATVVGSTVTHSLWEDMNHLPSDRLVVGMAMSYFCGVGVGIAGGLIDAGSRRLFAES